MEICRLYNPGIRRASIWFPDMPCKKRVYRVNWAMAHWSATRNEEHAWSCRKTAGHPLVLIPHRFAQDFRCSCFQRVVQDRSSTIPWKARGAVVSLANRHAGVPTHSAPPRLTPARPGPQVVSAANPDIKRSSNVCQPVVNRSSCSPIRFK